MSQKGTEPLLHGIYAFWQVNGPKRPVVFWCGCPRVSVNSTLTTTESRFSIVTFVISPAKTAKEINR